MIDELQRAILAARASLRAQEWGVWCIEEGVFCSGTVGTEEYARAELPRWVSGEAAAVDPTRFHYDVRTVDPAVSPWARKP